MAFIKLKGCMSGHSKWSTIKNKKGVTDAKRSKVFTQVSKIIRSAVKEGKSGDPQGNASLRVAVEKARAANMPKDKIQKAIDRAMGKSSTGASLQEITYEGYGPGGVGLMISVVTDNVNRTSADVKFIMSRNQGSLGGPGSTSYMFKRSEDGAEYESTMPMAVEDESTQKQVQTLMDALRDHDDIEDVYCSGEWPGKE
jgi:YebC/PmpR family DNA-binding regulatory protein